MAGMIRKRKEKRKEEHAHQDKKYRLECMQMAEEYERNQTLSSSVAEFSRRKDDKRPTDREELYLFDAIEDVCGALGDYIRGEHKSAELHDDLPEWQRIAFWVFTRQAAMELSLPIHLVQAAAFVVFGEKIDDSKRDDFYADLVGIGTVYMRCSMSKRSMDVMFRAIRKKFGKNDSS